MTLTSFFPPARYILPTLTILKVGKDEPLLALCIIHIIMDTSIMDTCIIGEEVEKEVVVTFVWDPQDLSAIGEIDTSAS